MPCDWFNLIITVCIVQCGICFDCGIHETAWSIYSILPSSPISDVLTLSD